jgi:hypothetical protein
MIPMKFTIELDIRSLLPCAGRAMVVALYGDFLLGLSGRGSLAPKSPTGEEVIPTRTYQPRRS